MNQEKYKQIAEIFKLMNDVTDENLKKIMGIAKNNPCPIVRHEAIFALGEMGTPNIISFLEECARGDDNYVVIHEALISIGTLGNQEKIPFLETFLDSPTEDISSSAKIAIERINQTKNFEKEVPRNKSHYTNALHDTKNTNRNDRIQILFQLMRIADVDSINAIKKCLLEDPCKIVRHEAGFVLGEIGNGQAINAMKDSLKIEKVPIVLHEVLCALGTSKNKIALLLIESFLDHEDYLIRESAKIGRDRILHLKNPYSGARHFAQ